jgi:hypothetical protein
MVLGVPQCTTDTSRISIWMATVSTDDDSPPESISVGRVAHETMSAGAG